MEILDAFLNELPALRKLIWQDIDAAYEGDPAATSYEEIVLAYPSIEAIAIQRMAQSDLLYKAGSPFDSANDDGMNKLQSHAGSTFIPERRSGRISLLITAPAWSSVKRARSVRG